MLLVNKIITHYCRYDREYRLKYKCFCKRFMKHVCIINSILFS